MFHAGRLLAPNTADFLRLSILHQYPAQCVSSDATPDILPPPRLVASWDLFSNPAFFSPTDPCLAVGVDVGVGVEEARNSAKVSEIVRVGGQDWVEPCNQIS